MDDQRTALSEPLKGIQGKGFPNKMGLSSNTSMNTTTRGQQHVQERDTTATEERIEEEKVVWQNQDGGGHLPKQCPNDKRRRGRRKSDDGSTTPSDPAAAVPSDLVAFAADCVMSLLVLSTLCVYYWRGTWQLLDVVLFPGRPLSVYCSLAIGYSLCWLTNALQGPLGSFLTGGGGGGGSCPKRAPPSSFCLGVTRCLIARVYSVVFAFGNANLWRGVWQLQDLNLGKSWASGTGSAVAGIVLLASTRTLRNVMAPPLAAATDYLDHAFTYSPTMFRRMLSQQAKKEQQGVNRKKRKGGGGEGKGRGRGFVCLFLADVTFSVVVIGSLVVCVWRGIWTVLDALLYPHSLELSGWSSLTIGYVIVVIAFSLQYVAARISKGLKANWTRVIFEDAFLLFASFGAINVWRGIWCLADAYIYPDDYVLSNWLTSVIGMFGSIVLFAGNTILARGVYFDGDIKDGSGCIFATHYFRKILKNTNWCHVPRDKKEVHENGKDEEKDENGGNDKVVVIMDGNIVSNENVGAPLPLPHQRPPLKEIIERETVL